VLVAGVGVHNVVEAARGPGPDWPGGPGRARILRINVQQLNQERDASIQYNNMLNNLKKIVIKIFKVLENF
jgi:hypothetical protein